MKFVLLISLKLTIANSFLLNIAEHENFTANKYENVNYFTVKNPAAGLGRLFTIELWYTYTHQSFLKVVVHVLISDQWNQTARFVRNPDNGYL